MRKFALVILDLNDQIIDRYNLDVVTNPTGLGFKLSISTLSGDVEDIITKVVQAKNTIKFTINQYLHSYSKINLLASWIQNYSPVQYRMALEYDDGTLIRYCEGRVTNLEKTELDEYKNFTQTFEFTQTTPFFVKKENTITITTSKTGKQYQYKYPYSYGRSEVKNNEINNPYIFEVPLIITIQGGISNPTISLLNENGEAYNTVSFEDFSLQSNEVLGINSAQKKIYKYNIDENGREIIGTRKDFRPNVNPSYDTFLRAINGLSTISVNTNDSTESFKLIGGWREYRL